MGLSKTVEQNPTRPNALAIMKEEKGEVPEEVSTEVVMMTTWSYVALGHFRCRWPYVQLEDTGHLSIPSS